MVKSEDLCGNRQRIRSPHLSYNFMHHEGHEGLEEDRGRNGWSPHPRGLLLLLRVRVLFPAAGLKRFSH